MLQDRCVKEGRGEPGREPGVGTLDLDWGAWISIRILKSYGLAIYL